MIPKALKGRDTIASDVNPNPKHTSHHNQLYTFSEMHGIPPEKLFSYDDSAGLQCIQSQYQLLKGSLKMLHSHLANKSFHKLFLLFLSI